MDSNDQKLATDIFRVLLKNRVTDAKNEKQQETKNAPSIILQIHATSMLVPELSIKALKDSSIQLVEKTFEDPQIDNTAAPLVVDELEENLTQIPEENLTKILEDNLIEIPEENLAQIPEENLIEIREENLTQIPEENLTKILEENLIEIPEENLTKILEDNLIEIPVENLAQIPEEKLIQIPEEISTQISEENLIQIPEENLSQVPEEKDDSNGPQSWSNNWRQFTSVLPGVIYLLSFGIQFDWCVRELDVKSPNPLFFMDDYIDDDEVPYRRDLATFINLNSWYVGAIIGGAFGAMLVPSFKKSTIYFLSGILMTLSAVIFLRSTSSELAGRTLFGFSFGLVQLTVIVHVSDIATKEMRSAILRKIVYLVFLSTILSQLVRLVSGSHWGWTTPRLLVAFEVLAVAVVGLILTPILTNETIPYLLLHKKEKQALKLLTKLSGERQPSRRSRETVKEMKLTIQEDKIIGKNIFGCGNVKPLFAVINVKLLGSILWNVPVILMLMELYKETRLMEGAQTPNYLALGINDIIQLLFGATILFASSLLGGHRLFYWLSLVSSGFVLWYFVPLYQGYHSKLLPIQSLLIIIMFGLITVGVTASQWIHTAQSFSILKKPWSIAIASLIEYAVHIGFISTYYLREKDQLLILWSIMSVGLILIPIILLTLLPKSTKLSLRDTRNIFNKVARKKVLGHDYLISD